MPSKAELEIDAIFPGLNLSPVGPNLFIGHIDRVPFRVEIVLNAHTIGLLFHTRFTKLTSPIPEHPPVPPESSLARLIAEKKADYEAEQTQAWLNLFAAHELIDQNALIPVLQEFAASIKTYVDFDAQPCFTCHTNIATEPIYHSEIIHLTCDACQAVARKKAEALNKFDPASILLSLCYILIAAIPAGLLWAGAWLLFEKLLGGLTMPMLLLILAYAALAAAIAFPIAWLLKKIPRRTIRFHRTINITACLATAAIGELVITITDFYKANVEPQSILHIAHGWLIVILDSGPDFLIGKALGLILVCAFTLDAAKPNLSLHPK